MSILSFVQFAREKKCKAAPDWSNQELADFFRAHKLLVQNGASIGMDRGRSDIGEPWMVFYDTVSQDVFLHIARIDDICILACDHLGIHLSATRIDGLISKFEEHIQQAFAVRTQRHANVIVHPASRIIMSISAVFLLFKFDSTSQTHAKEALNPAESGTRKTDGVHVRIQSTLARLFEGAETPVAMAALASVILASDIALGHDKAGDTGEQNAENFLNQPRDHDAALQLHPVDLDVTANQAAVPQMQAAVLHLEQAIAAVQASVSMQANTHLDTILAVLESDQKNPAEAQLVFAPETEPAPPSPSNAPANIQIATSTPAVSDSTTSSTALPKGGEPLSFQVLSTIADWNVELLRGELLNGLVVSASGEVSVASVAINLDLARSDTLGFEAETHFANSDLSNMLEHIISNIGTYELEFNGGVLSIIQQFDGDIDASMLGSWTNIMSDGSSIEIIGAVGLIDDVATLLSAA